ncbi:hypothetical protein SAMN05661080_03675 [Modestobacter sp. DSM 44400]|uniref:hypothetical protein n=1 Tax=Modestobacter sp. DSM 44400 TaxID=1550230 RepID=UPI0008960D0F|nr:hypothetical protein [Modestobacter sp. DSM 44400]SDY50046.1 hypothetical protein SAMN05661080_03675 [Modestobacter sp. DSM 44400]
MSSLLTRRPARLAAGAVAAVLLTLPLAACSFSSDNVSCSGTTCTATLSGDGAEAKILGTPLAFVGTQDGRATLSVGDASVSCAQGESVSAGPLSLTCTTVTEGSVKLTASAA